jgi:hypothetical protein
LYICSEYQSQSQQNYEELLSLIEFELFDMTPVMFTLYGEEFVDSITNLLKAQVVNSSVVGVLVSEQSDEKSTMVATLILSTFNDTILNELGDIETYIASYLYKNQDSLSLKAARVASVHSNKMSTLSSDSDNNHRGWAFIAGSSTVSSDSTETVATVRYSKVDFALGHGHSFGYGTEKRSTGQTAVKEVAELDDDYIEWYKFKVFHMKNADKASEGTDGWKTMSWSERSLQDSAAENGWGNRSKGHMGAGAIAGTVIGVLAVAVVGLGVVGYTLHRRSRRIKQRETPPISRDEPPVIGEINEQTALV